MVVEVGAGMSGVEWWQDLTGGWDSYSQEVMTSLLMIRNHRDCKGFGVFDVSEEKNARTALPIAGPFESLDAAKAAYLMLAESQK